MRELIGDYETFIQGVSAGIARLGIDRGEVSMMDHICYRVESTERYEELCKKLKIYALLLGENIVNGRSIATFELNEYLRVDGWTVPYLELPAPKESSPYKEGLEHAEFVVVGNLNRFMQRHGDLLFASGGLEKIINPEAGVKSQGISVKFHEQQLGAVVRIEREILGGESR